MWGVLRGLQGDEEFVDLPMMYVYWCGWEQSGDRVVKDHNAVSKGEVSETR